MMDNINYVFFEEFKKLEKLCNDIYASHNGVTHYIDDMKAVSYSNSRNIPNWETDLKQLKRLRYIRNNLAHAEGAFDENLCTQSDIEWIRTFYKRILNQSDPLAMQYRNSNTHAHMPVAISKDSEKNTQANTKRSTSLLATIIVLTIIVFAIIITLAVLFTLIAK